MEVFVEAQFKEKLDPVSLKLDEEAAKVKDLQRLQVEHKTCLDSNNKNFKGILK